MKLATSQQLTVFAILLVGICKINSEEKEWTDPNPFDPNAFSNDNWKCKQNSDCQNEKYCNGDKGCLAAATCKKDGFCECPDGRYGWRCQYATCEGYSYCENGGDCMIVDNRHECACSHDNTGRKCEITICNEHTCNGECTSERKCLCPKSISSVTDGKEICKADCTKYNPCKNGGICEVSNQLYTCKCSSDFHGPRCDQPNCDPDWCVNGLCMDQECVCFPGYSGKKCEKASCKDYAGCFDKGVCNDTNNVLKCVCNERKFAGTYCEFECTRECPENSKCGFDDKCYCDAGYYGEQCTYQVSSNIVGSSFLHMLSAICLSITIIFVYHKFFKNHAKHRTDAIRRAASEIQFINPSDKTIS